MNECKLCGNRIGSFNECEGRLQHQLKSGAKEVDEETARESVQPVEEWIDVRGNQAPQKLFRLVKLIAQMIRDYLGGDYKKIPWSSIAMAVFAVLYAVNPFDAIPDFIPFVGWVDDLLVMNLLIDAVRSDLGAYCLYRGLSPEAFGV